MLESLLARNIAWSAARHDADPGYFAYLAALQAPEFFWIGCSDSRVPANVVAGLDPGEVFVHRNVANVVHSTDLNLLSALEFAIEALRVREIIFCGYYGCGGIKAATENLPHGLPDQWLEPIRRLARFYAVDLAACEADEYRRDKLAELNMLIALLTDKNALERPIRAVRRCGARWPRSVRRLARHIPM